MGAAVPLSSLAFTRHLAEDIELDDCIFSKEPYLKKLYHGEVRKKKQ